MKYICKIHKTIINPQVVNTCNKADVIFPCELCDIQYAVEHIGIFVIEDKIK